MYPIWFLDHFILVTILVVVVTGGFAFAVYRYSLRVSEQHPAKSQLAAFGVQLTIVVLISLLLNNLYGAVRDREQRQWALRQTHLVKLQQALRMDSEKLTFVASQAMKVGRISNLNNGTSPDTAELATLFSPDVLTPDLANHYQEYWQDKQQLLKNITQRDAEFGDTVALVSKPVPLPSHAENQRVTVGRAFLEKCMGKGPGFTLEVSKDSYSYRFPGGGGGTGGGGNDRAPEHLTAILEAFKSISPTAETIKHCEALTKSAASIATKATELSLQAKLLAERTVLTGDCEYTKLD